MKNLHEQLAQIASLHADRDETDRVFEILLLGAEMALRRVEVAVLHDSTHRITEYELIRLIDDELKPPAVVVTRPSADTEQS